MHQAFGAWLGARWKGPFRHSYKITRSHHWDAYRRSWNSDSWSCVSIADAKEKYSWASKDYNATKIELDGLAGRLRAAVDQDDCDSSLACATEILIWGNVNRAPTPAWLSQLAKNRTLPGVLKSAVERLHDGHADSFDGVNLLMNSATTKLYSLADPSGAIAIYDGRVGAALGLLAKSYCREFGIEPIPEELRFRWGAARGDHGRAMRNPSEGLYRFPQLGVGPRSHQQHAEMVIRTTKLLKALAEANHCSVRDWEAGLFMLGYSMRSVAYDQDQCEHFED